MQTDSRPFGNVTAIPRSLNDAQIEHEQIHIDTMLIQGQLASRPGPPKDAPHDELRDWREWRARAAGAYQYKIARLKFLSNWIKSQDVQPVPHADRIVERMAVLIDWLVGDETDDLSREARSALDEMRTWLKNQSHPRSEIVEARNGTRHVEN